MASDRWKQIDDLFHAAAERAPHEREAFLDEACAGNESLRREVESLLAADSAAEEMATAKLPAKVAAELLDNPSPRIAAGQLLNQYRILSALGAGGMGEVFLAEDTRLHRKVALKLLPSQFASDPDRIRRFEQEAHAVSALNHPNIITLFDLGRAGEEYFLATEFIDGQTLRQRLRDAERLPVTETLDITLQICQALAAAHEAGIVHRDIKPENVMLRRDGYVKVLDFGLAKVGEGQSLSADSSQSSLTDPGTVMGTASYMSPEQARGQRVDARTDIFSLGIVLYEMIAGRTPFEGANMFEMIAAILDREPAPLTVHNAGVPEELQAIVSRMLRKDRDQRFQTINEVQAELMTLKRRIEFAEASGEAAKALAADPLATAILKTSEIETHRTSPNAAGLLATLRLNRLAVAIALAALVIAAIAGSYYFNRRPATLADKEPILLADFENRTGEDIWDGTLKQALAIALEQSPFINIFPEERARITLGLMGRKPDEPITRSIGREICQRRKVRVVLAGTIAKLDQSYTVSLEALDAQSGEPIARALEQATGRDQVMGALSRGATAIRGKLGESRASLQKYDAMIDEVTTRSLEAFKAYAEAEKMMMRGNYEQSLPFFKRAVEVDDKFARAWNHYATSCDTLGFISQSVPKYERAYELREQVSERERFECTSKYFGSVTGEFDKQQEVIQMYIQTYPQSGFAYSQFANHYRRLGQYEKAVEAVREFIRTNPDHVFGYNNLARSLINLNRYDEAVEVIKEGIAHQLDNPSSRVFWYMAAFAKRDAAGMNQQTQWFAGKPPHWLHLGLQARVAAFAGGRQQASDITQQIATLVGARKMTEQQIGLLSEAAAAQAYFGFDQQAKEQAANTLSLQRNSKLLLQGHMWVDVQPFLGWAFALSGDVAQAQSLTDELVRENPKNTLIRFIWEPLMRAAIELRRGNPEKAIQLLQPAAQYEASLSSSFRINWIRGQAYLKLRKGAEAAAEFQKIIDHRGRDVTSPLWPLAHLGRARAEVVQGNTARARQSYEAFFNLWKDADPDLPVLLDAKKEVEKLKS